MKATNYFNWPGKVWIYSDLHIGHENIIKFERDEFKNIDEHDEYIKKSITSVVGCNDTFVCLGDLGINTSDKWKDIVSSIECAKKVLVLGNHDKLNKIVYKKYFNEVYDGPIFVNKFIILSHEPVPTSGYFVNIHGHLHASILDEDNYVNASAKVCNYKPIDLDRVYTNKINNLPRIKARFGSEWYADKYIFVEGRRYRNECYTYKDDGHIIPKEEIEKAIEEAYLKYKPDKNKFVMFAKSSDGKILEYKHNEDLSETLYSGFLKYTKEQLR